MEQAPRSNHLPTSAGADTRLMEDTHRSSQTLTVLNRLLHIAVGNMSLRAILEQFIDAITSLSWLALESKGAIFLVGDDPQVLEMQAHRALDDSLLAMCARVPFGRCLCGHAALSGAMQFADCLDARHEIAYAGISPHGHYCIPIMSGAKEVFGVITLYLAAGHTRNPIEEEFLTSVANTLSGIIQLKQVQQHLRIREQALERKTQELEEVNTALRVLLKQRDEDKRDLEEKMFFNIKAFVQPYVEKLKYSGLNEKQQFYVHILESHVHDILSPFLRTLSSQYGNLTASELQVIHLVLDGKRTKDIAVLLNVSAKTIEVHRKHIRKKLGLRNQKTNLRAHLLSLQ